MGTADVTESCQVVLYWKIQSEEKQLQAEALLYNVADTVSRQRLVIREALWSRNAPKLCRLHEEATCAEVVVTLTDSVLTPVAPSKAFAQQPERIIRRAR